MKKNKKFVLSLSRPKKKVGRPLRFATAEQLQEKIDEYFEKGIPLRKIVVGPANNREVLEIPVPTITGLVLYSGFCDRNAFSELEKKPEFSTTIKKARAKIEQHYEELIQSSTPTGAIFALKNFGWIDRQEVEHTGENSGGTNIVVVMPGEKKPEGTPKQQLKQVMKEIKRGGGRIIKID